MVFSYPIALFIGFALYSEYKEQQSERDFKSGKILYLKNIPVKVRWVVYVCDLLFLIYNYMTQFDSIPMALIVIITLNAVLNLTRISIDGKGMKIGNTFIAKETLTQFKFTDFNDKQDKFNFTFNVRKRPITKETFVKKTDRIQLEAALNQMKA